MRFYVNPWTREQRVHVSLTDIDLPLIERGEHVAMMILRVPTAPSAN